MERLSKEAVAKRILSARIEYFCRRELLENTSINKSTFVISNQVIKGSRGQTTEDLKALLKDKGLKDFPGTLEVLASILITLMRTEGKKGMYENHYTYTKETLPGENAEDRHLRVGLFPEDSIDVLCRGIMGDVGVGAFVSYDLLPPAPSVEESESLDLQ